MYTDTPTLTPLRINALMVGNIPNFDENRKYMSPHGTNQDNVISQLYNND